MMRVMLTGIAVAALATSMASAKQQTQIAASAEISDAVTLFELPKGSRPHDVAPAPDGKIWYTAQRQGALGILDPATGSVVQVPLGPDSSPHGVIQGPDGMAWITDGGQNAIVRYNPANGKIDVWKLPADTGYTNLNTGAFDGQGVHWFTGQNGIYGRVDAATGKVDVWKDPKGRGPYGIATAPDGTVWYVSLAGSHLARIDSATGQISVIEPPTPGPGCAGSGLTAGVTCGSPVGTAASSIGIARRTRAGRPGSCPARRPRPMRYMSTSAIWCGSAISATTPRGFSTRKLRSSPRAIPAAAKGRTSVRFWAARAR